METLLYARAASPVGPLLLARSERGLVLLAFEREPFPPAKSNCLWRQSRAAACDYLSELEEYFAGKRQVFTFALDLRGTEFQLKCWRALLEIPYGETRSYREIAEAVGRPRGFRAVGMANNRNPIAIVVPCHRVIASDGSLAGYGGGLKIKQQLLELEARARGGAMPHIPPPA